VSTYLTEGEKVYSVALAGIFRRSDFQFCIANWTSCSAIADKMLLL
jgi:hypothetical protein